MIYRVKSNLWKEPKEIEGNSLSIQDGILIICDDDQRSKPRHLFNKDSWQAITILDDEPNTISDDATKQ